MPDKTAVDFWFDPACPWAWITSRWIEEVARLRDIDLTWHIFSLAILNAENTEVDEEYRSILRASHPLGQVVAAVQHEYGNEQVKALYDALGHRIHLQHRGVRDATVLAEATAELGIPQQLVDRAIAGEFDDELRASHFDAISRVGQEVGTPVIAVDGVAFFGPVISPAPSGEQALRLFDGVVAIAQYDGFYELKRSRTRGPLFG